MLNLFDNTAPLEESGIEGTLMENSKEVSSLPGPNSDASEARSSDVDDISSAISISGKQSCTDSVCVFKQLNNQSSRDKNLQ